MSKRPAKKPKGKVTPPRKPGPHSECTLAAMDAIASWVAKGKSLRAYCQVEGNPSLSTLMKWLAHHEDLRNKLAGARALQADTFVDECVDIADDEQGDPQRAKLRVDTRIKLAAMLSPKKYGPKLDLTVDDKRPTSPEERRQRITELLNMGVAAKKPDEAAP